jgi:hypothetical protein
MTPGSKGNAMRYVWVLAAGLMAAVQATTGLAAEETPAAEKNTVAKVDKTLTKTNADYNFLYVSDVVRPGEQFNRRVNTANLPPAPAIVPPLDPQPRFKSSDYWAHGVGVSFKIQF